MIIIVIIEYNAEKNAWKMLKMRCWGGCEQKYGGAGIKIVEKRKEIGLRRGNRFSLLQFELVWPLRTLGRVRFWWCWTRNPNLWCMFGVVWIWIYDIDSMYLLLLLWKVVAEKRNLSSWIFLKFLHFFGVLILEFEKRNGIRVLGNGGCGCYCLFFLGPPLFGCLCAIYRLGDRICKL